MDNDDLPMMPSDGTCVRALSVTGERPSIGKDQQEALFTVIRITQNLSTVHIIQN